jgi:hypothetical protein
MSDELRQAIQQTATGPKRVRTDAGEVESQDISQQIEADKYLSAKAGASTNHRGLRFSTIVPPGSV